MINYSYLHIYVIYQRIQLMKDDLYFLINDQLRLNYYPIFLINHFDDNKSRMKQLTNVIDHLEINNDDEEFPMNSIDLMMFLYPYLIKSKHHFSLKKDKVHFILFISQIFHSNLCFLCVLFNSIDG